MDEYIGLIFGCTKKQEEKSCPFRFLRKMPIMSAIGMWRNFSNGEKIKMIRHHKKCLQNHYALKEYSSNDDKFKVG